MATKTRIVGFNPVKMKNGLTNYVITVQTKRLVDFAVAEIERMGNRMASYAGAHGMDRTGHLLNSLCWGVTYKGAMKASGFYRPMKLQSRGIWRTSESYLHEFFANDAEPVNGRQLAEDFIKTYKAKESGWTVFFAVLAPYWGYWESGFKMKIGLGATATDDSGKPRSTRFMQFHVMTHVFDEVRMALRPAKTHLSVHVPKYSYKNPKYKNRRGYRKIGILR